MSKNILVFQDLIPNMPVLRRELQSLGANIMIVTGGQDVLEKTKKFKPGFAVLSAVMPQMSTIELFHKIRETLPECRVFIIRKGHHEYLPDDFIQEYPETVFDIGGIQKKIGEVLIPVYGGNLSEYIKKDLSEGNADTRETNRVNSQASVRFEHEGKEYQGHIVNISRSGLLIKTNVELSIGHKLLFHIQTFTGEQLSLPSEVVRIKEKDQERGLFVLGTKFLDIPPEDAAKIELWVSSQRFFVNQNILSKDADDSRQELAKLDQESSFYTHADIQLLSGGQKLDSDIISIHPHWILIETSHAFKENDQAEMVLTYPPDQKISVVVQVAKMQTKSDGKNRVGMKYLFSSNEQRQNISNWVAYFSGCFALEPSTAPEVKFVQTFLLAQENQVEHLVTAQPPDFRLRFVGQLTDLEKSSFEESDSASMCIRKQVILRTKCGLFSDFVPVLQANSKIIGEVFLGILKNLLFEVDALEREADEEVKKAVASENNNLRQRINAISSRLHEIKTRMILRVEERLSRTSLANSLVLADVIERAENYRMTQTSVDDIKYDRKKAPQKEEKKRDASVLWKYLAVSRKVQVGFGLSLLAVIVSVMIRATSGMVSTSSLELGVDVVRAKKIEDGLLVYCQSTQWEKLREVDKFKVMESLEVFLTKEKLRQAKLLDEKDKLLASTAVILRPIGKPPVYSRRIPKLKSF